MFTFIVRTGSTKATGDTGAVGEPSAKSSSYFSRAPLVIWGEQLDII